MGLPETFRDLVIEQNGGLEWANTGSRYFTPGPHRYPERYLALCDGEFPTLEEHREEIIAKLGCGDLVQNGTNRLTASEGELTGVEGLLRLSDKLLPTSFEPENVLLIGAIQHKSLLTALIWLEENGWFETPVTLVDSSEPPIRALAGLNERGGIPWKPKIELVNCDIRSHEAPKPYDLVLADIVAPYNIQGYDYPVLYRRSPYEGYEQILSWVNSNLSPDGFLLERVLVTPEEQVECVNKREDIGIEGRTDLVMQFCSELQPPLTVERPVVRDVVANIFEPNQRGCFCGLEPAYPFIPFQPLVGKHAENVMQRLHKRHLQPVNQVEVFDPHTEFKYISFCCSQKDK